jgi:hypothetical protein
MSLKKDMDSEICEVEDTTSPNQIHRMSTASIPAGLLLSPELLEQVSPPVLRLSIIRVLDRSSGWLTIGLCVVVSRFERKSWTPSRAIAVCESQCTGVHGVSIFIHTLLGVSEVLVLIENKRFAIADVTFAMILMEWGGATSNSLSSVAYVYPFLHSQPSSRHSYVPYTHIYTHTEPPFTLTDGG